MFCLTLRKDISRIFPLSCDSLASFSPYFLGRGSWGKKGWAAEVLDLAEHLIGMLEADDRDVLAQSAVIALKAVGERWWRLCKFLFLISKRIDERLQSET